MRAAASVEERLMDEALTYFMYADRFGWTPDQVDDCPAVLADRMMVVAQTVDEIKAERDRAGS